MKGRLTISFGEVADRERKHPGEEASGHIEKGDVRDKRRPSTRAESRPGIPGPTYYPGPVGFRAWSHRGPWAGPVG